MAKIKELLAEREKLAKYDELTKWKKKFENITQIPFAIVPPDSVNLLPLPDHIKQIIVSALDAEIKKLNEE